MAGVPIPKEHFGIGENLIGYVEDFHGLKVNIRKTYTDKMGNAYVGKGLCMEIDDWNDLVSNIEDLSDYIDGKING